MASPGTKLAEECLALCRERDVDPYLLFSLRHWNWLDHSRFGAQFKAFIELHTKATGARMMHDKFWSDFKKRVGDEIDRTGVMNIAPTLRVEAYHMDELLAKYHAVRNQWPPHKPYLIQMRPGLFILLSNCQAGFHLVRDMARTGRFTTTEGKRLPVKLLYEKQVVGEPCRIILDCEAYMGDYDGVLSKEELVESMRHVPVMLTRELVRIGAIRREDKVIVVEKNKSREDKEGGAKGDKVSFHFIFNIVGIPTGDLKCMFAQVVLAPYLDLHARAKKDKNASCIARCIAGSKDKDGVYTAALAHVDPATVKGMHQFSLVFSRKEKEQPPRIDWIFQITQGGAHGSMRKAAFHGTPLAPAHERALDMLYLGGFVHWTPHTIVLSSKFRIAAPGQDITTGGAAADAAGKKRKFSGDAPLAASASSVGYASGPRGKECSLPSWMASKSVRRATGCEGEYAENTQMPCLQAKYNKLSKYIPSDQVKPEDMVHVIGGIYCPVSVLNGHPSVHSSNGVFAARNITRMAPGEECDVVYASCPNCVFDKSLSTRRSKGDGSKEEGRVQLVEMVPGTEDYQCPWVIYTRENYSRIAEAAERSSTHPAKHVAGKKIPKKTGMMAGGGAA